MLKSGQFRETSVEDTSQKHIEKNNSDEKSTDVRRREYRFHFKESDVFPPSCNFPNSQSGINFTKFDAELIPYGSLLIPNAHPRNENPYRNVHRLIIKGKLVPGYFSDDFLLTHYGLYISRLNFTQRDDGFDIASSEIIGINLYDATYTVLKKSDGYAFAFRGKDTIYSACYSFPENPIERLGSLMPIQANWPSLFENKFKEEAIESYLLVHRVQSDVTNLIVRTHYENKEYITYGDLQNLDSTSLIKRLQIKEDVVLNIEQIIKEGFIERGNVLSQCCPINDSLNSNDKVYKVSENIIIGTHYLTTPK